MQVGSKVQFGQYPQGTNGEVEPLVWRVLSIENGRALLITDKLIDAMPYSYNIRQTNVTWETCTLRKWMNHQFIIRAFNNSQLAQIATVTNQNPDNPFFGTQGCNPTQERIFALSIEEVKKYFRDDDDRMAAITEYAKKQGAYTCDDEIVKISGWKNSLPNGEKTGWWYLRSPSIRGNAAAVVCFNGHINQKDYDVLSNWVVVRPAFWLKLE